MSDYRAKVEAYCDGVLSGEIVAGRWVASAVQRYRRDLEQCEAKGWRFDHEKAGNIIEFIQTLKHTKSPWNGKPFILSPCQLFMVWNLFGFVNGETGFRRFHTGYLTVGRKWGKSTFICAIALALLFVDDPLEVESEGYAAATKDDQAARLVTQAMQMIKLDPVLSDIAKGFKFRSAYKEIYLEGEPWNGSYFKSLGQDSHTADSLNPAFVLKDELHAWTENQRGLKAKLATGGGVRNQPLDLTITTAGDDKSTLWIEEDRYAQRILETSAAADQDCIDDGYFAFIARLDEKRPCDCGGLNLDCLECGGAGDIAGDDPYDESVWQKANPDIGVTPKWDYLRKNAKIAKEQPSFELEWVRYHCNQRVSNTYAAWSEAQWAGFQRELRDWSEALTICGGVDLGGLDDLAAYGLCAKFATGQFVTAKLLDGTEEDVELYLYEITTRSYISKQTKRDLNREPWRSWINSGQLRVCDHVTLDLKADLLKEWYDRPNFGEVAFDPKGAQQLMEELDRQGVKVVKMGQNYTQFNEPIQQMQTGLKAGTIIPDVADRILKWSAGNAAIKKANSGDQMYDKVNSKDKIDPLVAVTMAYRMATLSKITAGPLFLT